jgi:hypothetical protein
VDFCWLIPTLPVAERLCDDADVKIREFVADETIPEGNIQNPAEHPLNCALDVLSASSESATVSQMTRATRHVM